MSHDLVNAVARALVLAMDAHRLTREAQAFADRHGAKATATMLRALAAQLDGKAGPL